MMNEGPGKTCLKCGHTRTAADSGPAYACPKCGAVYAKVEAAQRAREAAGAVAANPYAPPAAAIAPEPAWGAELAANRARDKDFGVMAHVVYLLYVLPVGFTMLVGLVIAYVMRGRAQGSWVASHFDWQISTFWRGVLYTVLFLVLALLIFVVMGIGSRGGTVRVSHWAGFAIAMGGGLLLIGVWSLYRIIKGWYWLVKEDAVA